MAREHKHQLEPVHFLKVSHHGSSNGTPGEDILEQILPGTPIDERDRVAILSTFLETYPHVPDERTIRTLEKRGLLVLRIDNEVKPGGYVEVEFPEADGRIRTRAVPPPEMF